MPAYPAETRAMTVAITERQRACLRGRVRGKLLPDSPIHTLATLRH
ncbi:MAG: hypothetical protein ACLU0O_07325 [Collinsella sp.]